MRKFLKLIIVGSLFSSLCMPLCAQMQAGNPRVSHCPAANVEGNYSEYGFSDGETLILRRDEKYTFLMVNGTIIPNASVKIVDSHSLVPLRIISEELGMNVEWKKKEQLVTIKKKGTSVEVIIGKTKAKVNGEVIDLETPAAIINGTVYVPVKFVAEAFSLSIGYSSPTSEGMEFLSHVLGNPLITLDEKPTENILNKEQALSIAKKELTDEYNAFLKEEGDFKEVSNYDEVLKKIEKSIQEMSVQSKLSRYWIINGPKTILVDEYTGNVFFVAMGYNCHIDSVNGKDFEIFGSGYFAG